MGKTYQPEGSKSTKMESGQSKNRIAKLEEFECVKGLSTCSSELQGGKTYDIDTIEASS